MDDQDKDELWTKGAMTGQGTVERMGERKWVKVIDLFDNGVEQCSNCLIEAGRWQHYQPTTAWLFGCKMERSGVHCTIWLHL